MSTVKSVPATVVRSVLNAFGALTWPVPNAQLDDLASQLGWTSTRARRAGATLETNFPTNHPRAQVLYDNENVGQVSIYVTDAVEEPDAAQTKEIRALAETLRDEVTSVLGSPVQVRTGKDARYTWDLANRGRVAVADVGAAVQLIVLQERYADLERDEEGLGISPNRDPEADLV